jgi:hypothetical protein
MEAKYGEAVKAGVIGGVLLAILFVAVIVIGIMVTDVTWFTLGELLVWVLLGAVMLLTGVLAVAGSGPRIANVDEAALGASLAGGIAGVIGAIVFAIAMAIIQFFLQYNFLADLGKFEVLAARTTLSMVCGGIACCLLPFIVLAAIILAAIGGWIYWLAVGKK